MSYFVTQVNGKIWQDLVSNLIMSLPLLSIQRKKGLGSGNSEKVVGEKDKFRNS